MPWLSLGVLPLAAQTTDWARVTVGISAGTRSGTTLWDITDQPILSSNMMPGGGGAHYPPDLYHLHREVGIGLTISAQANFYSSPHFGLTFGITYLGLKLNDICTLSHDGGDAELATACAFVGSSQRFGQGTGKEGLVDPSGVDHSATAMLFEGGVILRPFKPATLQPFFKALAGFATTPHSTVRMESVYGLDAIDPTLPLKLVIYQDYAPPAIRPVLTVGGGLTTAPNSGMQVHVEIRETLLPQSVVTEATTSQNLQASSQSVIKGFMSFIVGFELVLKRDRGKRY